MSERKKAVFLDRDGVLNQTYGNRPPNNAAELILLPGVPEAVRNLNQAGFLTFVVTNQGGVGLGYMTKADLDGIHAKLAQEIAKEGGKLTAIRACMHKPRTNCSCRKPKPGMILDLAAQYNIDLSQSYLVGDRDVDIEAGLAAGTTTILVGSEQSEIKPNYKSADLLSASELIIQLEAD